MAISAAPRPTRRTPKQDRSKERYDRILDAAIGVIGEIGVDRATLTDVASRADCAIGSIYQYFSGKEQLIDAVSRRLAGRFASIRASILEDGNTAALADFVPTVLRPIVQFWNACPAMLHLLDRIRAHVPSPQFALQRALGDLLATENPALPKKRRAVIARVTVELMKAALQSLSRAPSNERRALLNEFELAIQAYLASAVRR